MKPDSTSRGPVTVIGAGAAGLFAASALVRGGRAVTVLDHRSEAALKLRLAGASGLNITNSQPLSVFAGRYGESKARMAPLLADFPPEAVIAWVRGFGVGTFEGSGGKILTDDGDGNRLIAGVLGFLEESGLCEFRFGHSFYGFSREGRTLTTDPSGATYSLPAPVLFALGGASWPLTGSDGAWVEGFRRAGIAVSPLLPSNCGFDTPIAEGERGDRIPLKNVKVSVGSLSVRGDITLTPTGIEGGPVYAHASALVKALESGQEARVRMDLCPDLSGETVARRLSASREKASASTFVRKTLKFGPAQGIALKRALGPRAFPRLIEDPSLAKDLPLPCLAARPVEEAISVSGGVAFDELDDGLMLKKVPGAFCAGEMIDWDAPTGGFLLTGCFATAHRAVAGILSRW